MKIYSRISWFPSLTQDFQYYLYLGENNKKDNEHQSKLWKNSSNGNNYTIVFNSAHTEVNRRVLVYEITWMFFLWGRETSKSAMDKKPHVNANMKLLQQ